MFLVNMGQILSWLAGTLTLLFESFRFLLHWLVSRAHSGEQLLRCGGCMQWKGKNSHNYTISLRTINIPYFYSPLLHIKRNLNKEDKVFFPHPHFQFTIWGIPGMRQLPHHRGLLCKRTLPNKYTLPTLSYWPALHYWHVHCTCALFFFFAITAQVEVGSACQGRVPSH